MTLWKTTRVDGKDFFSHSVNYGTAVGGAAVMVASPGGVMPGPGWLHYSPHISDCVGMRWPCRLFEVTTSGATIDNGRFYGAAGLQVVAERSSLLTLGPQSSNMNALITALLALNSTQVQALDDATGGSADHAGAWVAAWKAGWDNHRNAVMDAVCDVGQAKAGTAGVRVLAGLLVRDLIDERDYNLLTEPWRDVFGPIHPLDPDWGTP